MKVGIEVRIDVSKIDKDRLYQGKKGNYLTLTSFVDLDNLDQYDNNGFVTHKKEKEESKDLKLPILGNVKVFWREDGVPMTSQQQAAPQAQTDVDPFEDGGELPF